MGESKFRFDEKVSIGFFARGTSNRASRIVRRAVIARTLPAEEGHRRRAKSNAMPCFPGTLCTGKRVSRV
eukprot:245468-Rhodomonas_salina.2